MLLLHFLEVVVEARLLLKEVLYHLVVVGEEGQDPFELDLVVVGMEGRDLFDLQLAAAGAAAEVEAPFELHWAAEEEAEALHLGVEVRERRAPFGLQLEMEVVLLDPFELYLVVLVVMGKHPLEKMIQLAVARVAVAAEAVVAALVQVKLEVLSVLLKLLVVTMTVEGMLLVPLVGTVIAAESVLRVAIEWFLVPLTVAVVFYLVTVVMEVPTIEGVKKQMHLWVPCILSTDQQEVDLTLPE